jgi:hypothetical protein
VVGSLVCCVLERRRNARIRATAVRKGYRRLVHGILAPFFCDGEIGVCRK